MPTELKLEVTVTENSDGTYMHTIKQPPFEARESETFNTLEDMGEDLGRMICEGLYNKALAEESKRLDAKEIAG